MYNLCMLLCADNFDRKDCIVSLMLILACIPITNNYMMSKLHILNNIILLPMMSLRYRQTDLCLRLGAAHNVVAMHFCIYYNLI